MTLATTKAQTGINEGDFDSLVATSVLRPSIRPGLPAAECESIPAKARSRIRQAVNQIRDRDCLPGEQFRQPRAAFVHPAVVSFAHAGAELSPAERPGESTESLGQLQVVTINLSPIGAGVVVSARHEPLPRQVTLVVDGTRFDCDVRWSKVLGTHVTRYGLLFRDASPVASGNA